MEEEPQKVKRHYGINVVWVLVLMLAAFSGGVFVGLNPSWIPASIGLPAHGMGPETGSGQPGPDTRPATEPMSDIAQTQPATTMP